MAHPASLFHVILVIIFCSVEFLGELNLSCNRFTKLFLLLLNKFSCYLKLIFIHCPYSTAVLCSIIRSLSVHLGWIMHMEESFKELPVSNEIRVKNNSHSLSMHCVTFANLSIVGIICLALLISWFSCKNTWSLLKRMFNSPEATTCEISNLISFRCWMICAYTWTEASTLILSVLSGSLSGGWCSSERTEHFTHWKQYDD